MLRPGLHPAARRFLAAALILLCGTATGFSPGGPIQANASEQKQYTFYYPVVGSSRLASVTRNLTLENDRAEQLSALIRTLAALTPDLAASELVPQLRLRRVFLDRAGTAYVDLTAPGERPQASDVAMERLCVWSIVNTLCYNFTDVRQVKVLVGGDEAETLFGHIDLSRPLLPDPRLIDENER